MYRVSRDYKHNIILPLLILIIIFFFINDSIDTCNITGHFMKSNYEYDIIIISNKPSLFSIVKKLITRSTVDGQVTCNTFTIGSRDVYTLLQNGNRTDIPWVTMTYP